MSFQFNEQFTAASRQFADAAAQINHIALDNLQSMIALNVTAFGENANATFAFANEALDARDFDSMKALWPKGAQVARESVERLVVTGQDVLGRTVKAHEAITEIAKSHVETATADVRAEAEKVAKAAAKTARR